MIETLRELTIVGRHGLKSTTFEVFTDGGPAPVARLHKDFVFTSKHALSICTGPGLDVHEGWVTPRTATGPDKVRLGTVDHRSTLVASREVWTFEQEGLPALTGEPTGMTKLRYGPVLALAPMKRSMDSLLQYRIRFQGPGCEGFELARLVGVRHPRYSLRILDDRVSRRLALATVLYYDRVLDGDLRKAVLEDWLTPILGSGS
ncbi:hypothetical protein [Streptacidiphilus sp. EB129]|uniref:hypothetical protein n=1 Tax=Streptacidiphilus sp. EB129 TaxID=3156262 RepID=UPI0035151EFD